MIAVVFMIILFGLISILVVNVTYGYYDVQHHSCAYDDYTF